MDEITSSSKGTRITGLVSMALGILMGGGYITNLVSQADKGVKEIDIYHILIVAPLAFLLIGLLLAALRNRALKIPNIDKNNLSLTNAAFLVVVLVLGLGGYLWILGILQGLGYK